MTRRADIVNALRENPTAFADRLGFPLLTDLHRDWCREMVFGKYDHTLQAHRGSFKTTTVSIALWELLLFRPNAQMAFFLDMWSSRHPNGRSVSRGPLAPRRWYA